MKKLCGIFEKILICQFYRKYDLFILNTAFYRAEYGLLSSKTWQHCQNASIVTLSDGCTFQIEKFSLKKKLNF